MNLNILPFIKMQGAGNDFILLDNRSLGMDDEYLVKLAPTLCNRKFGIGSDGIIALEFDDSRQADLYMRYKNPDGSDAGMCGNGARCFAAYATTLGSPKEFTFRVHDKVYGAMVDETEVTIDFPLQTKVTEETVGNEAVLNVYTNTEHIVCPTRISKLKKDSSLIKKGRQLRNHETYQPLGTNVNFIAGTDANTLCLQTYERGVEDLTLACGTGAIASALAWHSLQQAGKGDYDYEVTVRGGTLHVLFSFDEKKKIYNHIKLKGPAAFVFEGQFFF